MLSEAIILNIYGRMMLKRILKETVWKGVDSIHVDEGRALVNMIMNVRVP